MRLFWKCLIVSKTLVRTKSKFNPFGVNWSLLSIFGPITPKSKNPHKFNSLNLLKLNEIILEMPYCQLNFGKNKLLPFWGPWSWFWYLGPLAQNKKGHKLRHCGLLGMLNTIFALLTQEEKIMTRNPMFLKYTFCKISFLCILGQKCNSPHSLSLHNVYSIYYFLGF